MNSSDIAELAQQHTQRVGNLVADILYGFLCALIADQSTARLISNWILFAILFGCTCYFGYQFVLQMGHIGMRAVYMAVALFMLLISLLLAYNMFMRAWYGGGAVVAAVAAVPPVTTTPSILPSFFDTVWSVITKKNIQ